MSQPYQPKIAPMAAGDFKAQWIADVRAIIARDGHATRPGSGPWIEVQNPNHPEVWQPLNLPSNGILFASAADRDTVLEKLVGKSQ